jgi:hypothetical protein
LCQTVFLYYLINRETHNRISLPSNCKYGTGSFSTRYVALRSAVIRLSTDAASYPWRRGRAALWKLQNSLKNGLILYWNGRPYILCYRQPLCGKDGWESDDWIVTVQRTTVVTDWIITCFKFGGYLSASHCRGPISMPGQIMWSFYLRLSPCLSMVWTNKSISVSTNYLC